MWRTVQPWRGPAWGVVAFLLSASWAQAQQGWGHLLSPESSFNLLSNGGFELARPAYWEPSGAGATWTSERARTPNYSLKLSGSGAASWTQREAIRNWTPRFPGNAELVVGGWVWMENVNTNPTTDAGKFQLVFEFFDRQGRNLLGGPLVIDLPQQQPSTGRWVQVSNESIGPLILPGDATSARITFRKGASAVGTAYLDDVFIRARAQNVWPGDIFNANMDVPEGWYYWWNNFSAGQSDWPQNQPFVVTATTAGMRRGSRALQMIKQDQPGQTEAVAISQRMPVTVGEPYLVSFWMRYENVANPDRIGTQNHNVGLTVLWYNNLQGGAAGWGEIGGLDIRLNGDYNPMVIPLAPRQASAGWTQYAFVVYPREGAVGMEIRLRQWHDFKGTTYWDDVVVAKVSDVVAALPNLLSNGGFEIFRPAYWEPSGAGATWTSERYRTPNYSLKLSGSGAASWTQREAVRNWVEGIPGWRNPEIEVGGWVWTENVNTNPTTDAGKFQLVFEFFDAQGRDVLGGPVILDVPQAQASTGGWVEISSRRLGPIIFPGEKAARRARITFRKGANATGTVYLDDVFIRKVNPSVEGWPGDFFNANMDVPEGWYYWWLDFPLGKSDWPQNQPFVVTLNEAVKFQGSYSVRMTKRDRPGASEAVVISQRVPITPGQPVLVSYRLRHDGVLNPDSIGLGNYNVGLTALWYTNLQGGAAGWGERGGVDVRLNGDYNPMVIPLAPRQASADWRHYAIVFYPPADPQIVGMELRLRQWHNFSGTTYWDNVAIVPLGGDRLFVSNQDPVQLEVPEHLYLHPNYPNPFRLETTIRFELPRSEYVRLEVYNLLGQRVAVLVEGPMPTGRHEVRFHAGALPSGVYLYRLEAGDRVEVRKMTLLK
ncbi:MAG: T9SS type A sorting domain-containing protein [Bacteroidetes bacterium]|nr:T9SS type A sorting domain-containing protein [Bacteroidota bacterium]